VIGRKRSEETPDESPVFFIHLNSVCGIYCKRREVRHMFCGGGGRWIIGIFAVALGAGILIAAVFPIGALLFLVAFLLIASGCTCLRR